LWRSQKLNTILLNFLILTSQNPMRLALYTTPVQLERPQGIINILLWLSMIEVSLEADHYETFNLPFLYGS
jgi:hypothetical protein